MEKIKEPDITGVPSGSFGRDRADATRWLKICLTLLADHATHSSETPIPPIPLPRLDGSKNSGNPSRRAMPETGGR